MSIVLSFHVWILWEPTELKGERKHFIFTFLDIFSLQASHVMVTSLAQGHMIKPVTSLLQSLSNE